MSRLDIYVFGEGSSGELGLGSKKIAGRRPMDVKRPVLNSLLAADIVGVVQVATGGMHCAAITFDNQILTWGVNDDGALGRDTWWAGVHKDIIEEAFNADTDSNGEYVDLNPLESTPTAVAPKSFSAATKFVQVACSDSATFALTQEGEVYGWGTFRVSIPLPTQYMTLLTIFQRNDGTRNFAEHVRIQRTPAKIAELKAITSLATGSNHLLALDIKGNVWGLGVGEQCQLGHRLPTRGKNANLSTLTPRLCALPKNKVTKISAGDYHSFAIHQNGDVYAWGLNNFGQTAIVKGAGEGDARIELPTIVSQLRRHSIRNIAGGGHHSLAVTSDSKLLVWGRCDGSQVGLDLADIDPKDLIFDDYGNPRILSKPTIIAGKPIQSLLISLHMLTLSRH